MNAFMEEVYFSGVPYSSSSTCFLNLSFVADLPGTSPEPFPVNLKARSIAKARAGRVELDELVAGAIASTTWSLKRETN